MCVLCVCVKFSTLLLSAAASVDAAGAAASGVTFPSVSSMMSLALRCLDSSMMSLELRGLESSAMVPGVAVCEAMSLELRGLESSMFLSVVPALGRRFCCNSWVCDLFLVSSESTPTCWCVGSQEAGCIPNFRTCNYC